MLFQPPIPMFMTSPMTPVPDLSFAQNIGMAAQAGVMTGIQTLVAAVTNQAGVAIANAAIDLAERGATAAYSGATSLFAGSPDALPEPETTMIVTGTDEVRSVVNEALDNGKSVIVGVSPATA